MKEQRIFYFLGNTWLHILHLVIILFVMTGWLFSVSRPFHLAFILLVLSCWFILGRWFGYGYCPVTDWQWKLKAHFGKDRPDASYIRYVLQYVTGRELNPVTVDKSVLIGTGMITGASLCLNIWQALSRLP